MKALQHVIRNVEPHWVGDGFPVRSLFSYADGNRFDPFLLLDYAGPYKFAPAEATRGVGEHPHRGFETVTIVYQGELEHRDSSGSHGTIGPGDVQWMTAAAGLVHEEFHSERFTRDGGVLEMIQLWVNLPAKDKSTPPGYQGILASDIPQVELPDQAGSVRVIAGQFQNTTGAARTFTPINAWDVQLKQGARTTLPLPDGHHSLIVVQSGSVQIGSEILNPAEVAVLERTGTGAGVICLSEDARCLVLTGEPIGEPVVGQGPFVMNTREEIGQAIDDFRRGRMGRLN